MGYPATRTPPEYSLSAEVRRPEEIAEGNPQPCAHRRQWPMAANRYDLDRGAIVRIPLAVAWWRGGFIVVGAAFYASRLGAAGMGSVAPGGTAGLATHPQKGLWPGSGGTGDLDWAGDAGWGEHERWRRAAVS